LLDIKQDMDRMRSKICKLRGKIRMENLSIMVIMEKSELMQNKSRLVGHRG
jgi:hypothetical protein